MDVADRGQDAGVVPESEAWGNLQLGALKPIIYKLVETRG